LRLADTRGNVALAQAALIRWAIKALSRAAASESCPFRWPYKQLPPCQQNGQALFGPGAAKRGEAYLAT